MHLLLLLSLISVLTLSAASSQPLRFSKHRLHRRQNNEEAEEYIEVTRPLSTDSLTPSCTLPILSHTFGNTVNLPPTNNTYSPPDDCTWSNATLQFSASSNGSQPDHIAAVWLSGAELLRTSTPDSITDGGVFWNVRKDVTKYASLLRQSDLTLSVMLENIVNDFYTGVYTVNLTFIYYDIAGIKVPLNLDEKSSRRKLSDELVSVNLNKSLELYESPADLIIPISAAGDEGFWFKIESELDSVYHGIKIPLNTYRAVIEVYVSFHDNDEFWYSNPPDYYLEINNLETKKGHGAYREVLVKLDDYVVGSVIPFPVILPGGINPSFWEPVVAIGAFDFPSYEIELTPFLSILLDGKLHYFGLKVADALSYWLVNANLHLWLDDKSERVQAGSIKYSDTDTCLERESKFQQFDGKFEIEGERESEFSGWVNCSGGNFTIKVERKIEFENTIEFKENGTEKSVEHEVTVKNEVTIKNSSTENSISNLNVETKYTTELKTSATAGSGEDNYLVATKLENSVEEEKKKGKFESKTENKQKCSGWMFVHGDDVLSGSATTSQSYHVKDSYGCYTRRVTSESGAISLDTERFRCAVADAY